MSDDQTQIAPKDESVVEVVQALDAVSVEGTDAPAKHRKSKKKSSRDTTETSSVSEVDDKEESESGSQEAKKPKKSKKPRKEENVTEAEEDDDSHSAEPPAPVGPTHGTQTRLIKRAKDIPGVVASFNSCLVPARKAAKHDCKDDINIERFCQAFYDLLPVLRLLGTAFYFVEKDIVQKLEAIAENKQKSPEGDHKKNLIDFIHWERETNPHIRKDKHSTARHALRLMRALHFISLFLDKLNEPGVEPKPAAKDAYAISLHQFHPWSVRTAVSVAFYTLPYRKSFFKDLHMDPNASGLFQDFVTVTTQIRDRLNIYYDANDWQNLP